MKSCVIIFAICLYKPFLGLMVMKERPCKEIIVDDLCLSHYSKDLFRVGLLCVYVFLANY